MLVLGIETSCDETAAAVVKDGTIVCSNVISSQIPIHSRYGGIVPEIASRQHMLQIVKVVELALSQAGVCWSNIDAIAVTKGPGLAGSLLVGVNMAKALAMAYGLPFVGVNHLEGHIYANWLIKPNLKSNEPMLPSLCLIASGGHTDLVLMRDHGEYILLGRTRDDAAGEAFDKVSRVLGLGYPGGPIIERVAKHGESPVDFPRAWLRGTDDFSFSGLKTAVIRKAEELGLTGKGMLNEFNSNDPEPMLADVAAGFQEAVVDALVKKTAQAASREGVKQVILSGGVAANKALRTAMEQNSPVVTSCPPPVFCTDNAAMIAACGYRQLVRGDQSSWHMEVYPNLRMVNNDP